jgi:hypothetical protein
MTATAGNELAQLRIQEYVALRKEILKHIEFRHQITGLFVTSAGALLTLAAATENPWFLLVYSTPALFLALKWFQQGMEMIGKSRYLRENYEEPTGGVLWESHLRKLHDFYYDRSGMASALGLFLIPQVVALVLALVPPWRKEAPTATEWGLMGWDALAIFVTGWLVWRLAQERR